MSTHVDMKHTATMFRLSLHKKTDVGLGLGGCLVSSHPKRCRTEQCSFSSDTKRRPLDKRRTTSALTNALLRLWNCLNSHSKLVAKVLPNHYTLDFLCVGDVCVVVLCCMSCVVVLDFMLNVYNNRPTDLPPAMITPAP